MDREVKDFGIFPQLCKNGVRVHTFVNRGTNPTEVCFEGCSDPECYYCTNTIGVKVSMYEVFGSLQDIENINDYDILHLRFISYLDESALDDLLDLKSVYRVLSNGSQSIAGVKNRVWFKKVFPEGGIIWYEYNPYYSDSLEKNLLVLVKKSKRSRSIEKQIKQRLKKTHPNVSFVYHRFSYNIPCDYWGEGTFFKSTNYIDVEDSTIKDFLMKTTSKKWTLFGHIKDTYGEYLTRVNSTSSATGENITQ